MKTQLTAAFVAVLVLSLAPSYVGARAFIYLDEGSPLFYLPGHETAQPSWVAPDLIEDASWTYSEAGFGVGYGDGDDRTVLGDMRDSYATVYLRAHFTVGAELGSELVLKLESWFDDGFVAYLNGVEIGRANVPEGPLDASTRASHHEVSEASVVFTPDAGLLRAGDNVLAVEVHNASLGSSDLSYLPRFGAFDSEPEDAAITHGPYSSGSHGSNDTVRRDLVPLFESYGVDIVFAGHDHSYERSTVGGVKHVITGGGGGGCAAPGSLPGGPASGGAAPWLMLAFVICGISRGRVRCGRE